MAIGEGKGNKVQWNFLICVRLQKEHSKQYSFICPLSALTHILTYSLAHSKPILNIPTLSHQSRVDTEFTLPLQLRTLFCITCVSRNVLYCSLIQQLIQHLFCIHSSTSKKTYAFTNTQTHHLIFCFCFAFYPCNNTVSRWHSHCPCVVWQAEWSVRQQRDKEP